VDAGWIRTGDRIRHGVLNLGVDAGYPSILLWGMQLENASWIVDITLRVMHPHAEREVYDQTVTDSSRGRALNSSVTE
jgi:hypothetical protein